jgi:hypothetical protein
MRKTTTSPDSKRILLTGVFGPFGVDDKYGRKENIMELMHNQVTREQGLASFRFHHRSFGLYFLAENVNADVTVLDFPSKARFEFEAIKGYDAIGISFIAPNFIKAREMARYIRKHLPNTEIILGGHGAAIEGIEELIPCDHVVKGEGIRWLREYCGEDPDAPFNHPMLPSTESARIMGVTVPGTAASVLVPGVGCVNACKFCCTSHFFGRSYTPFLSTGEELFETACRIADARGTDEFFIMDENFLKDRERAMELLRLMELHKRYFRFDIFSSAEAITAFGVDNLVRLGVSFIWIGVESSRENTNYAKNKGIDTKQLVKELRDRGMIVLASGILCHEEHTPENIGEDIDFMVSLNADFVQFMLLTPLPVTALYEEHKAKGLLRHDLPFEEWHGQHLLSYRHPAFPGTTASDWLKKAFRQDHDVNSSSMYRVLDSTLRGYTRLAKHKHLDPCLTARKEQLDRQAREWMAILPAVATNAINATERIRARQMDVRYRQSFPLTITDRARRLGARALVAAWNLRLKAVGDVIQPRTIYTRYPATERPAQPSSLARKRTGSLSTTSSKCARVESSM